MDKLIYLVPVAALCAVVFAAIKTALVLKAPRGTEKMIEIANAIKGGATAFLYSEYKILVFFVFVVFIAVGLGIGSWITAVSFIVGALFSTVSGFVGMKVATCANLRTANGARLGGMKKALPIAFSGGTVMGMGVAGLGLLGVSLVYIVTKNLDVLFGFGLGASSIALFARVGGGIYTKAADVGADLVGKVESGIPEDDPRNPAVIADNVGDNVGDVAGMGADLFESYVGAIISAATLGATYFAKNDSGILFPLLVSAIGIIASIIGTFFVRGNTDDPHGALKRGTYASGGIVLVLSIVLSYFMFDGSMYQGGAIVVGVAIGILIGLVTEFYTSDSYLFVRKIANQSQTGSATNIITGLGVGMQSTAIPIVLICIGIIASYKMCGLYGIALAAVGMLSTTGMTVAVDAYGPIADNAGGIAQMSGLDPEVREVTDKLDAVGNTTAAIGKGFAIGSAALTALALFVSFAEAVKLQNVGVNLLDFKVIVGLFVGGMLPFLFSSMTMNSVSRAANQMIEEVRRQFKNIPGILEGKAKPDYKTCVAISTKAALNEMILPGLLSVVIPIAIGALLGTMALGGLLAGALVTGVLLAIFMSNSGGAWDNAKKFIENGNFGGKNSTAHKAAVVGDTVGDPFKDTAGPSINILIKLMTIVSVVFAPLFMNINGGGGMF